MQDELNKNDFLFEKQSNSVLMLFFKNQFSNSVYSESLLNTAMFVFICVSMREFLAKFSAIIQISTFQINYMHIYVTYCVCVWHQIYSFHCFLGNTVD